jgi:hypothetical protein
MSAIELASNLAAQQYTICAAISFGWTTMEMVTSLVDDYELIRHWRWGHLTYFGSRYTGFITSAALLGLTTLGQAPERACEAFFILANVSMGLLFLSSSSIFWLRAGVLSKWNRPVMVTLGIYAIVIVALAMRGSVNDYVRINPRDTSSNPYVCLIVVTSWDQALVQYLMASFDILTAAVTFYYLYRDSHSNQGSWLASMLRKDQVR